jgi:hypothetical protein
MAIDLTRKESMNIIIRIAIIGAMSMPPNLEGGMILRKGRRAGSVRRCKMTTKGYKEGTLIHERMARMMIIHM